MNVEAFVIVAVVRPVVVAAGGFLVGGEQVEKAHHQQPEPAAQRQRTEVRREVLGDPAGRVEIHQHSAPSDQGEREEHALEFRIHGVAKEKITACQAIAAAPMVTNNPSASQRMKRFLRTV